MSLIYCLDKFYCKAFQSIEDVGTIETKCSHIEVVSHFVIVNNYLLFLIRLKGICFPKVQQVKCTQ